MPREMPPQLSTGHFQRAPIEWRIDQIIDQINEEGQGIVSLVCLDIDGFSQIEAEHGYALADALLDEIAGALHGVEGADFADRYVRDSFLVIYRGLTLEEAFLAAEQLRRSLAEQTFSVSDGEGNRAEISVTFSAGVATYPGDPEDRYELISLAEEGAGRAFESGGDRTVFGRAVNMTPKTSHYTPAQLERLKALGRQLGRSEASLLREALDDLLRKYDQRDLRRRLADILGWMSGRDTERGNRQKT